MAKTQDTQGPTGPTDEPDGVADGPECDTPTLKLDRLFLSAMLEHTSDHVYFKDREGRFLRVSRAMATWLGVKEPAQLLGKTDFDFFDRKRAEPARADEQRIMETGKPLVGVRELEVWPDGRETWVSTTKGVLKDAQENVLGTFGVSRDMTWRTRAEKELAKAKDASDAASEQLKAEIVERKRAQEELQEASRESRESTAQLIQSDKLSARGQLTASVAHELKQPLNTIKIIGQSILRDIERKRFDEQNAKDDLPEIIRQVDRMSEIIDHMRGREVMTE